MRIAYIPLTYVVLGIILLYYLIKDYEDSLHTLYVVMYRLNSSSLPDGGS